ncbi:hypothetical protein L6452_34766 [Arctium lappa]|uniref:Uncharacterized protein n=1 Tax=Arctium lappa TaxID=4217 RepID=A0ACB8YK55_ARCLA|nr:hypothetical protein L6452_34766 [Arctium lappa]
MCSSSSSKSKTTVPPHNHHSPHLLLQPHNTKKNLKGGDTMIFLISFKWATMEQQREREKRSDDEREMESDGERRTLDRRCEKAGEAIVPMPKARREKKKIRRFAFNMIFNFCFLI